MYYVTMQITFLTRKFRNVERNLHCDIVHITTVWVSSLTLNCNGVFAIKAYNRFGECKRIGYHAKLYLHDIDIVESLSSMINVAFDVICDILK